MHNYKKIETVEDLNKMRLNPNEFIEHYNYHHKKSLSFKNDMKKKKSVSAKVLITCFLPVLKNDFRKFLKMKKGGNITPPATDTISNAVQGENLNNFFYYLPRNPPFTSIYNTFDLSTNTLANQYPPTSTYSRASF